MAMAIPTGLGGVVSGLINSGRDLPTVDIQGLLNTINSSGQYQQQLINSMPDQIKQQLMQYSQSLGAGADKYKAAIQGLTQSLQGKSAQLYGPNSDAAVAAKTSAKENIYSTLPGTQNAIRNALAATGGLNRGQASASLAQPYMQAAQQYGQQAGQIDATQTAQSQQAQQKALELATSMDASMFQNLFGMTKDQAAQILTTGTQALREQLAQLLNQSNTQTNQILGAEGVSVNNAYQNAVTRNSQQGAITSGLVGMGIDAVTGLPLGAPGMAPTGAGPSSSAGPYADLQYA